MKPLGPVQEAVLKCLREHGSWTNRGTGSGWVWDTNSGTERVLDSLVVRGLVTLDAEGVYRPK